MQSEFSQLLYKYGRTEINQATEKRIDIAFFPKLNQPVSKWMYIAADCRSQKTQWLSCSASYSTAHLLYKLYSLLLNCTYSNYTQAAATCSAVQQHNTFTVQIMYKLYSVQLNCTYSNYRITAATCSAAQQHSTFPVQILYSLQLNCTYGNYTEPAATCSAVKQHTNFPADVFWSAVHPAVLNYTVSVRIHSVMSLDWTFQIHATTPKTVSLVPSTTKHTQLLLCPELYVYADRHIHRLDSSN